MSYTVVPTIHGSDRDVAPGQKLAGFEEAGLGSLENKGPPGNVG